MTTSPLDRIRDLTKARTRPARVAYPGADGVEIGVRLLSEAEVDASALEAQRYVREKLPGFSVDLDPATFDRERCRQILWRACVHLEGEDAGKAFFPSPRDVRELDTVTVNLLFDAYLEVQESRSPFVEYDAARIDDVVAKLDEGDLDAELGYFSADNASLRAMIRGLVRRIREAREV